MTKQSYLDFYGLLKIKHQNRRLRKVFKKSFRLKSPKIGYTWYNMHLIKNFKHYQLADLWINTWELPTTPFSERSNSRRLRFVESGKTLTNHPNPQYLEQWGYKHSFADTENLEEEHKFTYAVLKSIQSLATSHYTHFDKYTKAESNRRRRRSKVTPWSNGPVADARQPLNTRLQIVAYRRFSDYVNLYNEFTNYFYLKFFHYTKSFMNRKVLVTYSLFFNFRGSRLFITLNNSKSQNYFNLSVGIFLKFFKNKKSLRKNKALRFLMVKYLRKLLILANLKNIYFYVRKTPVLFQELLHLLLQPLIKPITDPVTGHIINETPDSFFDLNVIALIFSNSKSFATQKTRKKGRIKRKIRRRLFRLNNVLD